MIEKIKAFFGSANRVLVDTLALGLFVFAVSLVIRIVFFAFAKDPTTVAMVVLFTLLTVFFVAVPLWRFRGRDTVGWGYAFFVSAVWVAVMVALDLLLASRGWGPEYRVGQSVPQYILLFMVVSLIAHVVGGRGAFVRPSRAEYGPGGRIAALDDEGAAPIGGLVDEPRYCYKCASEYRVVGQGEGAAEGVPLVECPTCGHRPQQAGGVWPAHEEAAGKTPPGHPYRCPKCNQYAFGPHLQPSGYPEHCSNCGAKRSW